MRKKVLIGISVLLLIGAGVYRYLMRSGANSKKERTQQIVEVQRGPIEDSVETTGTVQPLNRVEIKPPIAGRVEKLQVDEGSRVKAGQILGWMSSTDRAAILDAARAKGEDELKHWQDAYKPTPIIAPLSGTVILRNVVVGQTVDGTTVIYAMSDKLIVKADVDEADIGRVKLDMPAVITLDSYPNEPIEGRVFQILHEGINVSNVITYPVKIEPKRIPPFFRSQMTANIRLVYQKKEDAVLVPAAAVMTSPSGDKQVLVPGPNGKPVPRAVEVGLESDANVQILSGLEPGEKIVITSKRYVPQQAATSSPLIMGGPRRDQAGQGQGQGAGQGGRRRQNSGAN